MSFVIAELAELAKANPRIEFGRFRPGKGGDDERIRMNWQKLTER